jgi:hypothetical protein
VTGANFKEAQNCQRAIRRIRRPFEQLATKSLGHPVTRHGEPKRILQVCDHESLREFDHKIFNAPVLVVSDNAVCLAVSKGGPRRFSSTILPRFGTALPPKLKKKNACP